MRCNPGLCIVNGTEKLHHAPHDRLLVAYYLLLYSSLSCLCLRENENMSMKTEKSQETGFAICDCMLSTTRLYYFCS